MALFSYVALTDAEAGWASGPTSRARLVAASSANERARRGAGTELLELLDAGVPRAPNEV